MKMCLGGFRRHLSTAAAWMSLLLLLGWLAHAQEAHPSQAREFDPAAKSTLVSPETDPAPIAKVPPPPKPTVSHAFWDRKNVLLFSGVAATRGLDYASTRNFEARGRQEILLPQNVVDNSAAFASIEAAGTATSVSVAYLFHRTGHHSMERWTSLVHIGVTAFGDARNYALKSRHPH